MIKVSHMAQVAFLDNINSHILSVECPIASFSFNVVVVKQIDVAIIFGFCCVQKILAASFSTKLI